MADKTGNCDRQATPEEQMAERIKDHLNDLLLMWQDGNGMGNGMKVIFDGLSEGAKRLAAQRVLCLAFDGTGFRVNLDDVDDEVQTHALEITRELFTRLPLPALLVSVCIVTPKATGYTVVVEDALERQLPDQNGVEEAGAHEWHARL